MPLVKCGVSVLLAYLMGSQSAQVMSTVGHIYVCNMDVYPFIKSFLLQHVQISRRPDLTDLLSYPHRVLFRALLDSPPFQIPP